MKARVNHFHPGFLEGVGHDLGASVMAVQPGFAKSTLVFLSVIIGS